MFQIPRLYLIIGAALVAAGVAAFIGYQHSRIETLELENDRLEHTIGDKNATIDAQARGIDSMITASVAAEAALKAAGDTLDTTNRLLAAERAKRNAKVETDYALPDCAALLAIDLARVCPAHAQRLRDAAHR